MTPTPLAPDDAATAPLVKAYNDVVYSSYPNANCHPDHLAAVATLLGLDPAPVAGCRVLELACGDGMNLVPVAAALPQATCVGVDFAARPLAEAQRMADDLGLANVRLLNRDLRDLPADLGQFDYVIAHGLYSWIPADVRAHVLPLIARHLAPKGVAFVSYNTLPGCHARRAVWEMLKYHTRDIADPQARLAAARALTGLVSAPVTGENETQAALRAEVRHAGEAGDSGLAHDEMSEHNDPVYFHEFMADAQRAGLAFAAEAELATMMGPGLDAAVRQQLGPLDRLTREQYLDFIYFRRYRESLLCHAAAATRFVVQPERTLRMHATASRTLRRTADEGVKATEADAVAQAVQAELLARWPATVPVAELASVAARVAAAAGPRPVDRLLAEMHVAALVDLHTRPRPVATSPGERPEAFAPARWLARDHDVVPTLHHRPLRLLDANVRRIVGMLDGTRTRDDLVAAIGGPLAGPDGRDRLETILAKLAQEAVLVR